MPGTNQILVIDPLHPIFKTMAEGMGYTVHDMPAIPADEMLATLHNYAGLAVRTRIPITAPVIAAGTALRFIARAGAGLDNIDTAAAQARGIQLISAADGNKQAVAEHTLGMLLSLMNNLRQADMQVRQGLWLREENRGHELYGKTVAIIGFGHMGDSFARLLQPFNVRVLAYDKYKTGFSTPYATEASMEEVVKHADVVSFHIPLTRETRQMVNEEYLFHFKKTIYLLNTARGEILNTAHLLQAINAGRVTGAGLDVLEIEKPGLQQQSPWFAQLAASPRVLLSPHVAGWSVESYYKISQVLAQQLPPPLR